MWSWRTGIKKGRGMEGLEGRERWMSEDEVNGRVLEQGKGRCMEQKKGKGVE